MEIVFKPLETEEMKQIWMDTFQQLYIHRKSSYYSNCLKENKMGKRITLLAFHDHLLVGVGHLIYVSDYPYFKENRIPEISDLNVFPLFRKQGIATAMITQFEQIASERVDTIGIGVGLYESYGPAQRLYCKLGFLPDGNGISYNNTMVQQGSIVKADDSLALYFTKPIKK